MKKMLFVFMLAVASLAQAQKPCKIEGKIVDEPNVTSVKIEIGGEQPDAPLQPAQTVEVKKGKFTFDADINAIVEAVITRGEGENARAASVFLVPGENLKLTLKGEEYFYDGSKIYKSCNVADQFLTPKYQAYIDYYHSAIERLQKAPEDKRQALAQLLQDTLQRKNKVYADAIKLYADNNKNDEGAMLYLSKYQDAEETYSQMSPEMKEGRVGKYYKSLCDYMTRLREQQAKEAAEAQAKLDAMSGAPAKDFTLNDIKGNPLSLSSLRGKYVVLDFWGSWCSWCIKGIPDMKKYYEKYAGKFEILGIDCNDSEDAWKKAVEKYELPWLHVYNPRTSTVIEDFGITGFPTKIVVDPQGNVAKIIVGEDPAFYTYLDEILGK